MLKITDKSTCSGCSACANICPKNCITMMADEKGFLYPQTNENECINCGQCEKVCPMLNSFENSGEKITYASYNKDENIREIGSSGGLFGAFADEILSLGGVVFGASFSTDCKSVKHIAVENKDDLKKLYGSKYLQSEIDDSYKLAENYLKQDRFVLFTGTSCQISGLKLYLKKDYEKLVTVDVICHGTPSPKVWGDYATAKESEKKAKGVHAEFRNKRFTWQKSVLLLLLSDGTEYCKLQSDDNYIKGFLSNLYLRPSCYKCLCKGKHVMSDITLGDFWGVESVLPDINVDNGISAVLLNTPKGKNIFEKTRQNLQVFDVKYDDILKCNPSLEHSVAKPNKSDKFWNVYHKQGLIKAYKVCLKDTFIRKCYRFALRIYRKITKR